jgi:hypothetical protein
MGPLVTILSMRPKLKCFENFKVTEKPVYAKRFNILDSFIILVQV